MFIKKGLVSIVSLVCMLSIALPTYAKPNKQATLKQTKIKKVASKKQTKKSTSPIQHIFFKEAGSNFHVLKVDLNNSRVNLDLALAYNKTNRKENVSKMAKRYGAIAAINGSFFHSRNSIHSAVGLLMSEGVVIADSGHRRTSMGITEDNKIIIGIPKIKNFVIMPELGVTLKVNGINQVRGKSHITIYNNYFGKTTKTSIGGREILVNQDGIITGYRNNNSTIPDGGFVISMAKANSSIADKYPVGTQVYLNSVINSPWNKVKTLVTGSPQLLKNGKIYNTYKKEKLQASIGGNATRTAIGVTANNKLLMITATGGTTFNTLAKIMKRLGAKDAMALDGGGSTDMYLKGKTLVTHYRPVTNALVVKLNR